MILSLVRDSGRRLFLVEERTQNEIPYFDLYWIPASTYPPAVNSYNEHDVLVAHLNNTGLSKETRHCSKN